MNNGFFYLLLEALNSKKYNFFFYFLIFSFLIFGIILSISSKFYLDSSTIYSQDVPSYLLYPFFPISEALSSHRTMGFPALLQSYILFDSDLSSLPFFLYLVYCLSITYIFFSLHRLKIKPLVTLSVALAMLFNYSFVSGINTLTASTLVSILMVLILALTFRIKDRVKFFSMTALTILTFFVYQTRPNLAPIIFLIPIWIFLINYFLSKNTFKQSLKLGSLNLSINIILIGLFLLSRVLIVSEFGMASFSGTVLSGQALSYYDKNENYNFSQNQKILIDKISEKRKLISYPCNKDVSKLTNQDRHECGNIWIMTAWLTSIKHFYSEEPSKISAENIEPWKIMELGPFLSRNNVRVDNALGDFSSRVILSHPQLALSRGLFELRFAFQGLLELFATKIVYFLPLLFGSLFWIFRVFFIQRTDQIGLKAIPNSKEFTLLLLFLFISLSYMLLLILIPSFMLHLDYRYIYGSSIFFLIPIFLFLTTSFILYKD